MNSNKNNKSNNKPKFLNKTFPVIATGVDNRGHEYDADSAIALIDDLNKSGTFTKLSVMVNVANSIVMGKEDAKGMRNIARVQSFNAEDKTVDLSFFGKNVESVDKLDGMVVVPRIRTGRDTTNVECIMFFELVNPMDA